MLLLGVEIHRFGLQDLALKLAEQAKIPMAATMLGKGVVAETHPLYMGLYEGALGREEITRYVEASDCVVMLGTFMTDINLGIFTAELDIGDCIYATSEQLRIRHHHYHDVQFEDFLRRAVAAQAQRQAAAAAGADRLEQASRSSCEPEAPITITRLMRSARRTTRRQHDRHRRRRRCAVRFDGAHDPRPHRVPEPRPITRRWASPCPRPSAPKSPGPRRASWRSSATAPSR